MRDRAKQTLLKMALEPEWEAIFEPNSYGFRPGKSCHDAIEAIFIAIRIKDKFVLDADISKCFDRINHDKLLEKVNTFPKARRQIKAWLKAGILDKGNKIFPREGTPQGGALSPLLANIALHGMEEIIKQPMAGINRVNAKATTLIRYADDFVLLHPDLKVVLKQKERVEEWLSYMGLELSSEKTKIMHTLHKEQGNQPGFNFLGFNIRQYPVSKYHSGRNRYGTPLGFKTIIKPSKEKVKEHYNKLAEIIDRHKAAPQQSLIAKLAPVIRGWCNYYRTVCSKETYSKLNYLLFNKLSNWGYKRHPNKGKKWSNNKYFGTVGDNNWRFRCKEKEISIPLPMHSETKITRHIKVKGNASPYDGNVLYWASRMGKNSLMKASTAKLLKEQRGKCNHCQLTFKPGDIIESDHIIPLSAGGHKYKDNLQLLHKHCHDVKTKDDLVTIKSYKNKTEWNKVNKRIQKQFSLGKWNWLDDLPTLI